MKGGRTESGLMDREIGMAGAFSDEGNEKAGVFAISRDERAHWKSEFGGVRWKAICTSFTKNNYHYQICISPCIYGNTSYR